MLTVAVSEQQLEAELAAGALSCPGCCGRLARWVPRARARCGCWLACGRCGRGGRVCGGCGATHVLLAAWSVPRRRDGSEVIGEALRHAARGAGHRVIARRLGRPPGTVRAGCTDSRRVRSELLRCCATRARLRAGPGRARARPRLPGLDPRRRRRGARDRRPGVGASIRQPASRRVGARGVADRRAADRNATAAVAGRCSRAPARPCCHPAARGGCGSSAAATLN